MGIVKDAAADPHDHLSMSAHKGLKGRIMPLPRIALHQVAVHHARNVRLAHDVPKTLNHLDKLDCRHGNRSTAVGNRLHFILVGAGRFVLKISDATTLRMTKGAECKGGEKGSALLFPAIAARSGTTPFGREAQPARRPTLNGVCEQLGPSFLALQKVKYF